MSSCIQSQAIPIAESPLCQVFLTNEEEFPAAVVSILPGEGQGKTFRITSNIGYTRANFEGLVARTTRMSPQQTMLASEFISKRLGSGDSVRSEEFFRALKAMVKLFKVQDVAININEQGKLVLSTDRCTVKADIIPDGGYHHAWVQFEGYDQRGLKTDPDKPFELARMVHQISQFDDEDRAELLKKIESCQRALSGRWASVTARDIKRKTIKVGAYSKNSDLSLECRSILAKGKKRFLKRKWREHVWDHEQKIASLKANLQPPYWTRAIAEDQVRLQQKQTRLMQKAHRIERKYGLEEKPFPDTK